MGHNPHLKRRHSMRNGIPFDYVMDTVALLSPIALLPQVYQIYQTQSVAGLSLPSWVMLFCLNLLWIAYGTARKVTPIVIVNILMGTLNLLAIVGIVLYA